MEDLSLYVDASHCGKQIRLVVEAGLAADDYTVTPQQTDAHNEQIRRYAARLIALRDSL